MTRRLLNFLTTLSLLLCTGVCVFWLRSYWVSDELRIGRMHAPTSVIWRKVYSAGGTVGVTRTTITFPRGMSSESIEDWSSRPRELTWVRTAPNVTLLANLNIGWTENSFADTRRVDEVTVQVPYWMFAAVTGAIPGIRYFLAVRRRRRRARSCCPSCAYDLTANVSGVCPECGL